MTFQEAQKLAHVAGLLSRQDSMCCRCSARHSLRATEDVKGNSLLAGTQCASCTHATCNKCWFGNDILKQRPPNAMIKVPQNPSQRLTYLKTFCCCGGAEIVEAREITSEKELAVHAPAGHSLSISWKNSIDPGWYVDFGGSKCDECQHSSSCGNCVAFEIHSPEKERLHGMLYDKPSALKRASSFITSVNFTTRTKKASNITDSRPQMIECELPNCNERYCEKDTNPRTKSPPLLSHQDPVPAAILSPHPVSMVIENSLPNSTAPKTPCELIKPNPFLEQPNPQNLFCSFAESLNTPNLKHPSPERPAARAKFLPSLTDLNFTTLDESMFSHG